jgi:hypothetical protein
LTPQETWNVDEVRNPEPVQKRATLDGTRRTIAGWLTSTAERVRTPNPKSYEDAGFRRGRAQEFPAIPGEEMRNPDLSQMREIIAEHWDSRDPSPEPAHSPASRRNLDPETSFVSKGPARTKSSSHNQELSSADSWNYCREASRRRIKKQRHRELEEGYESDATYERRKEKERRKHKERERRDDDKVEQCIAGDRKRIGEDEDNSVKSESTANFISDSDNDAMVMMKQLKRPILGRGTLSIGLTGNENGSHSNIKLPTKSWFLVPHPPNPKYEHIQPLEDDIYRKLSRGGAQVALVGKCGTG